MYKKNLTIRETFALALQHHEKRNLQAAEQLYKQILEIEPDHVESIFRLGSLLVQTKNFDRAKILLDKAIQFDPNHIKAHNNLGIVFQQLGEPQKAINYYEKAINVKPDHVKTYNNILFTSLHFEKDNPNFYLSKAKEFRSSLKPIADQLLLKYQYDDKPKKLKAAKKNEKPTVFID